MIEPISLEQAKAHLRIEEFSEQDDLIAGYIIAAREMVEAEAGQIFARRAMSQSFDGFQNITLDAWPIVTDQPVTVSYLDSSGSSVATTGFRLSAGTRPARIYAGASSFPTPYSVAGAVTVSFTAGYAAAEVPERAKQAMLLLIAHWIDNPSAVTTNKNEQPTEIPLGVKSLCSNLPPKVFAV